LKPCSYQYIGRSRQHAGLIAQELRDVLNDDNIAMWIQNTDGYQGVRYEQLIPHCIKAIQQLDDKIDLLSIPERPQLVRQTAQTGLNESKDDEIIDDLGRRVASLEARQDNAAEESEGFDIIGKLQQENHELSKRLLKAEKNIQKLIKTIKSLS
jgi:hypothetical protein